MYVTQRLLFQEDGKVVKLNHRRFTERLKKNCHPRNDFAERGDETIIIQRNDFTNNEDIIKRRSDFAKRQTKIILHETNFAKRQKIIINGDNFANKEKKLIT